MNHEDGRREGGAQEIPPFSQGTRPPCLVTEARTFASRSGASARELGLAKVGRARRTAGRPAFAKATAASSHWGCDFPLAQGPSSEGARHSCRARRTAVQLRPTQRPGCPIFSCPLPPPQCNKTSVVCAPNPTPEHLSTRRGRALARIIHELTLKSRPIHKLTVGAYPRRWAVGD